MVAFPSSQLVTEAKPAVLLSVTLEKKKQKKHAETILQVKNTKI